MKQKSKLSLPKPKKKSRSYLKRKADTATSIKTRSKGYCELSGKDSVKCTGQLQTMHIIGRANMRLRFDPMNLICGCSGHHMYYTNHPWEFVKLVEMKFTDKHDYIEAHRNEIVKVDYEELLK